ncbi:MAG: 30S ribosomal protein S3 [Spirochaetales bacterium]|nr:30S ribosomal protein S3 [Spirochaetales bacterium]
MGQKVNPFSIRLGINKTWKSKWYVDPKEFANTLHEDLQIRKILEDCPETKGADVADIEIIRHPQKITIILHTGRPGVIIGVKGANIEKLGARIKTVAKKKIGIKIKEIKRPEANAQLIAMNVAKQLKSRASFRRTMKSAASAAMKTGVQGIKIKVAGRLAGAEMARVYEYKEGRIPLHTFRADIDYGFTEALTTFGTIGVKVWICNGEIYGKDNKEDAGILLKKQKERDQTTTRSGK